MDSQGYLDELRGLLRGLSKTEIEEAVSFYSEFISDAGITTRKEIETRLGTPKQLARKIMADHSVKMDDESEEKIRPAHKSSKMIWLITLVILSSPVTLGIGGGLLIALVAVILSMVILVVVLFAGLIVGMVGALYAGILLLFQSLNTGLFYMGIFLTTLGLLLILLPIIYWICRVVLQCIANFARYLYKKFGNRQESGERK
ncbi:MAG: DUF1700 domain-containing protein [Liquorilactobacillus hordei]|uniref:DUF1700 domain-containing protein n=1 Tax=Liquorilactobacillus hordei TaxID=468911 RepID=A0A3Q8CSJ6_9LACO|nr:DUF1700 domain-containing protein [Liquorilactobacillus hordei]AUJ29392.1 hypothetical protein BSQ49_03740 [Liquorilactobacillus hordei]MBZ2405352.1 hypothetical protein [Liquorilactobacillus hordei]